MLLCCFPTFRGSGPKKTRSERSFCCCRLWHKLHRHLSPSGTEHPQVNEGNPGQDHPGQAPAGIPLPSPTPTLPPPPAYVCVGAGEGKCGTRGTHPGQEQVVSGWSLVALSCSRPGHGRQDGKVSAGDQAPLPTC